MVEKLETELKRRGISLYRVSKLTGMSYELLRRSFRGQRKLLAEELGLILEKTGIDYTQIR